MMVIREPADGKSAATLVLFVNILREAYGSDTLTPMTKVDYQEQVDKYAKKLADAMKEVFRAQREFDRAQKALFTAQGDQKNLEHDYKYWIGKLIEQGET